MKSVGFITLGCAKNEVDTRDMGERLVCDGFAVTDDLSLADAIIVNTCSFIQSATEESIEAIFDALSIAEGAEREVPVIVAGCMPARYKSDLEEELTEVARFVPCSKEDDIAAVVRSCIGSPETVGIRDEERCGETFSYVKISDGCDRWCSYCTIPRIRGRYHSFTFETISEEVRKSVERGAKEVVLIAQDTGRWGDDLSSEDCLATLLNRLASGFENTWFRVMYVQPENVTDELLEVMNEKDNICPYIDIPLQHVSARILESMNRTGSRKEFEALLRKIREKVDDVAIRTTLIAGYPGETEEEFDELVEFVEESAFDYVGVFAYSKEEGTRAASLNCQIDDFEKEYRADRLRSVADAVSSVVIASRIGKQERCLVEGMEEDGQLFGRTMRQAPEVDGVTFVDEGTVGQVESVSIEDTFMYDMEASAHGVQ